MKAIVPLLPLFAFGCGEVTANGNDNPPPTIEAVSPERGGVPGGHQITVTGSGFTSNDAGDNYVVVGTLAATDVVADDDATLRFTLPAGPAPDALVDVTVFNNNGFAVLPDAIQYSPNPIVTSISPGFVRSSGDDITIFGSGFEALQAGDNVVTVGGVAATSVEVVSDTELSVEIAPRPDDVAAFAALDVEVSNMNGTAILPQSFLYTKSGFLRLSFDKGWPTGTTTIFFVDIEGDEVTETPIVTAPISIGSAALANNGKIYVVKNRSPRALGVLDPLTGSIQFVGPLAGGTVRRLAFTNGTLYGFLRDDQRLGEIDTDSADVNPIGSVGAYGGTAQAITRRNDSTLWAASTLQAPLRILNTSNSTAVDHVTLAGEVNVQLYDLMLSGGMLYGITRFSAEIGGVGQNLVRINTTTGAVDNIYQFFGPHSTLVPTPPLF